MTIPGPTRGEQTHQAIPQAAHHLFITKGYRGTSMCQVARETDIALGATTAFQQDAMQYFLEIYLHGMLAATE